MTKAATKRIFISYARRDGSELALRLERDLAEKGFDVWLDTKRIEAGASWTVEIERAIDRAHSVLAILTPGSFVSPICRAEQLRSLRKGKPVFPLLALAGADIPLHLEPANYRDFTTGKYAAALRTLLQDMGSGRKGAGLRAEYRTTLVTAPPLPRNYVARPEELASLVADLLADEPGPSVALTALKGMGGIGKTVLAQALSHEEAVQQAFPDGIVWITVGKEPRDNATTRLQEVRRALGDEPAANESELHATNRYRTVLQEKAALVILDDVWDSRDLAPFLAESPRSQLLFTTRDADIANAAGARLHQAELLTVEQSRDLLARWAGYAPADLPPEAGDLVKECGRLPLALSMVGAMLRGNAQGELGSCTRVVAACRSEKNPGSVSLVSACRHATRHSDQRGCARRADAEALSGPGGTARRYGGCPGGAADLVERRSAGGAGDRRAAGRLFRWPSAMETTPGSDCTICNWIMCASSIRTPLRWAWSTAPFDSLPT